MNDEELEAHLIELERSLHSRATRSNPEAVASLLADDFREFGASGRVWHRAEIIALLADEKSSEITSSEFKCQILTPHLALITYVSENHLTAQRSLRSSLWANQGGSWKMLFHQGTPVV